MKEIERLRARDRGDPAAGLLDGVTIKIVDGPEEYLFGEEKALLERASRARVRCRARPHYPPYERASSRRRARRTPRSSTTSRPSRTCRASSATAATSFRKLGTSDTPGTLIFTLSGDVEKPGRLRGAKRASRCASCFFRERRRAPRARARSRPRSPASRASIIGRREVRDARRFRLARDDRRGPRLRAASSCIDDETQHARAWPRPSRASSTSSPATSAPPASTACAPRRARIDELFDPEDGDAGRLRARALRRPVGPPGQPLLSPGRRRAGAAQPDDALQVGVRRPARAPKSNPARWRLPKIADYDETMKKFVYDLRQESKNPDWTYKEPQRSTSRFAPVAPTPEGEAGVRLAPDVWR